MKATLQTSYKATSRSLFDNPTIRKGDRKNLNHPYRALVSAVLLAALLLTTVPTNAAAQQNTDKKTVAADLLRQDILRFVGPVTDRDVQNAAIPSDGFLIRLNRRGGTPQDEKPTSYGMLVRGIDPTEQELLGDARDGKWDRFDLFRAAMVVEGIRDADTIRNYESKLNAVLLDVRRKLQSEGESGTPEQWTRGIFEALHRDLLTERYDIDCTHLGRVFETGHFNCVSATVLFNALGEKAGLDVVALEMPGHALSRVHFVDAHGDRRSMNLETTAPNWFSLQNETARNRATMHRVARPIPAVSNPATGTPAPESPMENAFSATETDSLTHPLREITPVQLVATIYYNRGVDFLAQKRYAEAAAANVMALHLDPASETAWGNLLATINNWAIELTTDSKRYDLAATLLDQGVFLDPNYDKFRANQLHVYYHWIRDLAVEGRVADARTVFAYADQRLPNDPDLKALMQAILQK